MEKTCTKCQKTLPATNEYFKRDKTKKDGLYPSCKLCRKQWWKDNYNRIGEAHRTRQRSYYQRNSDKLKEYQRDYHKRRVESGWKPDLKKKAMYERVRRSRKRSNGGSFTIQEWNEVLDFFGHHCIYCDIDITDGATVEHFIPVSKGGTGDISNIAPACARCNSSKNNRDYYDFIMTLNFD